MATRSAYHALSVLAVGAVLAFAAPFVDARQAQYDMIVAQDGSGDHLTVQAAIDAAKSFPEERIRIFVRAGVYREKVSVHAWNPKISLIGEDVETTIIAWDDSFDSIGRGRNSTFHTYTFRVRGDDFVGRNLTIRNDAGPVGQAVALHVDADRALFENCRLIGHQDTLYVAGAGNRQLFRDCRVEGTTDFIFGAATAVFERCVIHSRKDSYITAASTPEGVAFGLVFLGCRLTADSSVEEVYLGRPWRDHARTVFIGCDMGPHVRPEGWHDWGRPEARSTTFYAENGSTGPGADPDGRADWTRRLTDKEAAGYTVDRILAPRPPPPEPGWYDRP